MVAPQFGDGNAGNIILQAAQGILANQRQAQQLAQQREQAKANLQLQFEAADAREKEIGFKERGIKLQEDQLEMNKKLEGLRKQTLEADLKLKQQKLAAGGGPGAGAGLRPPEIRARRLTSRTRLQTNALNTMFQRFVGDRPPPTTTTVDSSGRKQTLQGQGPAALTFKSPEDVTGLQLKLKDDTVISPDMALIFGQIAAGDIQDNEFFKTQREGIQRSQSTLTALAEFSKLPEVQAILRGEGVTEEQIQEENIRLFGPTLGAQANIAEQRGTPDAVVAPTVDRVDFFKTHTAPTIDRAMGLLKEGNPAIMARIVRGLIANLDGPSRFQELSKLRVLMETEEPEKGGALFKLLFNELGGRALFDSESGVLKPFKREQ